MVVAVAAVVGAVWITMIRMGAAVMPERLASTSTTVNGRASIARATNRTIVVSDGAVSVAVICTAAWTAGPSIESNGIEIAIAICRLIRVARCGAECVTLVAPGWTKSSTKTRKEI
uniref:Putative secreted protein n=1 Tax=Anopheles darlingi TaxID=43151 RepID=A0A2M4D2F5_ANODA